MEFSGCNLHSSHIVQRLSSTLQLPNIQFRSLFRPPPVAQEIAPRAHPLCVKTTRNLNRKLHEWSLNMAPHSVFSFNSHYYKWQNKHVFGSFSDRGIRHTQEVEACIFPLLMQCWDLRADTQERFKRHHEMLEILWKGKSFLRRRRVLSAHVLAIMWSSGAYHVVGISSQSPVLTRKKVLLFIAYYIAFFIRIGAAPHGWCSFLCKAA